MAGAGDPHLAQRHQHLAVRVELEHLVAEHGAVLVAGRHAEDCLLVVDVACVDVSVGIDREGVRIGEHPGAEAPHQLAGRIEFQNRWIGVSALQATRVARRQGVEAPIEHPDMAVARHPDADDLAPMAAVHARRERGPSLDQAIRIRKMGGLGDEGLVRRLRACRTGQRRHGNRRDRQGEMHTRGSKHAVLRRKLGIGSVGNVGLGSVTS